MLNRNTIEYLKVINKVTDSVVLSYPYTVGNSDSGDIAFKIDISNWKNCNIFLIISIINL